MATSSTPLLADDNPSIDGDSVTSQDRDETTLLYGLITTSPTRPFATTFSPTLLTRSLALLLLLPTFILLLPYGSIPPYTSSITFLSFAIARQLFILATYFGSQIIVVHIEVVHHRLKAASAKAQEKWIKRIISLVVDGVILLGLLVSLAVVAGKVDRCRHWYCGGWRGPVTGAIVLGFLAFGLLLVSVPDFGSPGSVSLVFVVEKPGNGLLKINSSVVYGEEEDVEDNGYGQRRYGKGNSRVPVEHV